MALRTLFDEKRRKEVQGFISRRQPLEFRRNAPEGEGALGQEGPADYGSFIASGSAVEYYGTAKRGRSVHFNLKEGQAVEIEGFRFIYRGSRSGGTETDHLNFDIEYGGETGQVRVPFFSDSGFSVPSIGIRVVISPASRGSNPNMVSGTISVEDNR